MEPLSVHWHELAPDLKGCFIALFLDYDGTLTPIAGRPELARLSSLARKVVRDLSKLREVKVAIISGRSIFDLKKIVRVPGILYAGNHGFEIEGPKIKHVHPGALEAAGLLKKIALRLKKTFKPMHGILVENKKFTLSVHYRQFDSKKVEFARLLLFKEIENYLGNAKIAVTEGKKVWEIRPAIEWDKGKTVLWLFARALANAQKKITPIYIGDDQTDEDAFKALKHKGLTVKVTENLKEFTQADYCLSSPKEVIKFLGKLKQLKTPAREGK